MTFSISAYCVTPIFVSPYSGASEYLIKVSDNGEGFSPELRENILSQNPDMRTIPQASDGTGTGLVNVISRLRLYFHRHDVFDILDNEGGGTTFLLRIPNV